MGRKKRIWIPQSFYHVTARGNRRENLFNDEGDFNTFFYILQTVHKKTPFELASYCLMSNHYHLQLRSEEQSLSKVMSLINKRYADYFNTKYNYSGHVFEKRFFDHVINSDFRMLETSRYIHLNPVEAGMVLKAENYMWSSYRHYLYAQGGQLLNSDVILSSFSGNLGEKRRKYREFVEEKRK
jgi:REP element-mobilizing transposase RayT